MIRLDKLSKSFGSKVIIKNWEYCFENGRIYGLIGRNGIGKTTIMKCISGLEEPDEIAIFTEQGDVSKKDYLSRNIYYVSDEPVYYNELTLHEHLWMICKVEGYKKEEAKQKIQYLIEKYKMKEYLNFYPPAMSKGTLQRMLLMFTFLRKSPNFLLDEPFNGLDPIQLKQSLELCKGLKDEKCILISSHDIESLEEICDVFLIFTKEEIKEITGSIDRVRVNKMIGDSYD